MRSVAACQPCGWQGAPSTPRAPGYNRNSVRVADTQSAEKSMEAEQLNAIAAGIANLEERTHQLRRYL